MPRLDKVDVILIIIVVITAVVFFANIGKMYVHAAELPTVEVLEDTVPPEPIATTLEDIVTRMDAMATDRQETTIKLMDNMTEISEALKGIQANQMWLLVIVTFSTALTLVLIFATSWRH